ncbi:MAG: hypothetical protein RBU37_10085 [Myxococcota bacterium]|jgi:hypothetical protein|nr:hypothetical protein [Myxococcota bacterium]
MRRTLLFSLLTGLSLLFAVEATATEPEASSFPAAANSGPELGELVKSLTYLSSALESVQTQLEQLAASQQELAQAQETLVKQSEFIAAQSEFIATQSALVNAPPKEDRFFELHLIAELGFLAALSHTVQFGKDGTDFDYVDEGGQDTLFLVGRLSAELLLNKAHAIIFLYQPLDLRTQVAPTRAVTVDGLAFPANEALELRYGFDFYRMSYLYDFFDDPKLELSFGGSMQIRNAVIDFRSGDGRLLRSNRDVGPVPAFKLRSRYELDNGFWFGGEVDGMYAPIKYLNGGKSDVEGAIIDLSLRAGLPISDSIDAFINLRWLAGGAEGTSSSDDGPGDGYTSNWLSFLTVTLGIDWDVRRAFD